MNDLLTLFGYNIANFKLKDNALKWAHNPTKLGNRWPGSIPIYPLHLYTGLNSPVFIWVKNCRIHNSTLIMEYETGYGPYSYHYTGDAPYSYNIGDAECEGYINYQGDEMTFSGGELPLTMLAAFKRVIFDDHITTYS